MRFLLNWLLTSIAIAIATFLVPGIQPFGMADAWVCFAFVGLFLNIVDYSWILKRLRFARQAVPDGHLAAAHYYHAWYFSARSQQFYARAGQLPVGQSAGSGYLHCRLWIGLYGQYPGIHHAQHSRQHRQELKQPDTDRHNTPKEGRPSQRWAALSFVKPQRARKSTISAPSPNGRWG